ncbi:MAG: 3-hydroxyacyl-CoA dehydrogenase [Deltaproteobacteria bacterium HGW-Deltaproteobacteria-12]|jgi:3-hydroxybutyryl-CoA dehydrogenase|nr:MAG: 3-hydroxyacyl-CoA dehydrogenase [Deltaproteobacteria bacterium HGW-Deltaproteobacteria-12]
MVKNENIAIIGSGLMGYGIAIVFSRAGHRVNLVDVDEANLQNAIKKIKENLQTIAASGIKLEDSVDEILSRVKTCTDMESACEKSDFVFECVFEDIKLKQSLFQKLDAICDSDTILCSNTSVISITEIASTAKKKERILGTHWWNPPYLIPLVEVIRTKDTSDACMKKCYDLLTRVGKKPVFVHRDVPGFVGNRMQHALWREAFAIIDEGICDAETVDICVKSGFGMRLPVLGPVENADMVGLDLTLSVHNYLLKYLSTSPAPSDILKQNVSLNKLGFKTGEGFQKWDQDKIEKSRKNLAGYLLKALAEKD